MTSFFQNRKEREKKKSQREYNFSLPVSSADFAMLSRSSFHSSLSSHIEFDMIAFKQVPCNAMTGSCMPDRMSLMMDCLVELLLM